jgi:hypothetical protein
LVKQIIAYVLVVFGAPVLIGDLIWAIPGIILAKTIFKNHRKLEENVSAFIEGSISSVIGYFIFSWLNAKPLWIVPILIGIIVVFWNNARGEGRLNIPQILGVFISYIAILMVINKKILPFY